MIFQPNDSSAQEKLELVTVQNNTAFNFYYVKVVDGIISAGFGASGIFSVLKGSKCMISAGMGGSVTASGDAVDDGYGDVPFSKQFIINGPCTFN